MGVASVELKKVEEWAEVENRKLLASDKRFNNRVHIVHEDGSVFIVMNAFLEEKGERVVVFAEHYSPMVFHKSELIVCNETFPMKYKHVPVGED